MSDDFTTRKLNWLTCIRFDGRVPDYAYRVAAVIADHINRDNGRAFISDETIALETGCKWPRKAGRARNQLRACGWLDWQHTKTANVYEPNFRNVTGCLRIIGRARYDKRMTFLSKQARLGHPRPTEPPEPDSDKIDTQTRTPASDNPVSEPVKDWSTKRGRSLR